MIPHKNPIGVGPFFIENFIENRTKDNQSNALELIYEVLSKHPTIGNKITYIKHNDFDYIAVDFNEYLTITGSLDNNGIFEINQDYHLHIEDEYYLFRWLIDIADGRIIILESKCWFLVNHSTVELSVNLLEKI